MISFLMPSSWYKILSISAEDLIYSRFILWTLLGYNLTSSFSDVPHFMRYKLIFILDLFKIRGYHGSDDLDRNFLVEDF
jgi:hypothetical protein